MLLLGDLHTFSEWSHNDNLDNTAMHYNDRWLKRYATALLKRQWGQNLIKYDGMTLPGGLTYNGSTILDAATAELETLETEMSMAYELPLDFLTG